MTTIEKNAEELLHCKYLNFKKEVTEAKNPLKEKQMVCLFFGAGWCPICQTFLPKLIEFYNEVNIEEKVLEIIYISKDKTKEDFDEFIKEMPWLCMEFGFKNIKRLIEIHEVKGIPLLAPLRKSGSIGTIVTYEGKKDVYELGEDAFQKWID